MSRAILCIGTALLSTSTLAAPPSKQPAPSVPLIVDSAGTVVGPVVPVMDVTLFGDPETGLQYVRHTAALVRNGTESGKVYFGGPSSWSSAAVADSRKLQVLGPTNVYFLNTTTCGTGTPYVQSSLIASTVGMDLRGYGPLAVYPSWPGRPGPVLVRIDWTTPVSLGTSAAVLHPNGTCVRFGFATDGTPLYPVTVVSDLNWVGPYFVN